MHTKYWSENLKGRENSENLGIDGNKIFECIVGKKRKVVNWIHLAQDRDQWRTYGQQ
jgi:hypothetical protein